MFKFKIGTIILFIISIFFIGLSSKYNLATELIYSDIINRFIREKMSRLFGATNLPVGDIISVALLIIILLTILNIIRRIFGHKNFFGFISRFFWGTFNLISIFLFIYLLLFGLNYHTPPLGNSLVSKYNTKYSTNIRTNVDNKKRTEIFKFLEEKAVESRKIAMSSNVDYNTSNIYGVSNQAVEGFNVISDAFPRLSGKFSYPKKTLIAPIFDFFGLDGRYYILTNEVSLNDKIPSVYLPFITSKYMAMQRGVVKEDEAIFYAYLACINNSDAKFKYSGYLAALSMVSESLRVNDKIDYNNFLLQLDPDVKSDLKLIEKYKNSYGSGTKYMNTFKYNFARINGDIRIDGVDTQVTNLLSIYYSLFSYKN